MDINWWNAQAFFSLILHTSFFKTWHKRLETQNPVAINSILVARCSQRSVNYIQTHTRTHTFPLWQEMPGWEGERVNIWGKSAINREHCSCGWQTDIVERETGKATLHKFTAPLDCTASITCEKILAAFSKKAVFYNVSKITRTTL